jgi:hypothetical protein
MKKSSLGLIAIAAIFAAASAHAQGSATPTEGNPPVVHPAPVAPGATTGAGPGVIRTTPSPAAADHLRNGNPERPPASTQSHEPPSK